MKKGLQHNSMVAQAAQQCIQHTREAMRQASINYDQWVMLLFDQGCIAVETWVPDAWKQMCILQNEKLGFWDWWLSIWMQDDGLLAAEKTGHNDYLRSKEWLHKIPALQQQFHSFINKRIDEEI